MDIHVNIHGRQDLTGQIYRQLREGILDGRLAAGMRLPSTRELARQLGVSRKTTLDVFDRLITEGYLRTRPGDGTFVADGLARVSVAEASGAPPGNAPLPVWQNMKVAFSAPALARPAGSQRYDFSGGMTDKSQFPFEHWRRSIHHALRAQMRGRADYASPAGEQELRVAISRYLAYSRSVVSTWQDVFVTHGAQQALDLLARVLVKPGDVVAVEDPGYPPARACLEALGARVVGVRVDAQGLVVDELPRDARLVYVTPSHQFPLGMPMSLERRVALLDWARRHQAIVVEDDYDGEFRFEGRPMESLKSLDSAGLVAYVGTFSKTMFPELRVGYVVPPASLQAALDTAKKISDWHTNTMMQTAIAKFMLDGAFAKHLRRMHRLYEQRRNVVVAHMRGPLARWLEPICPAAGLHLSARLRANVLPGVSEADIIEAAAEHSVGLYGLSIFYRDHKPERGFVFGYGGLATEAIDEALGTLARVFEALAMQTQTTKTAA
ncbi:PLP-dependent aminotransferase family protein [Pararobbsia alpina]|uniref:MocR-like pyridoxine biosynthesis transcription factor PdxR n=1 Tax=Pararobbsia alpina TaxID=621374 RepID=UPI0039A696A0